MPVEERRPPFTRHQLKTAETVERWRAWVKQKGEQPRRRTEVEKEGEEGEGEGEVRQFPYRVTPDRWRVPGHVRWLLRQRAKARAPYSSHCPLPP